MSRLNQILIGLLAVQFIVVGVVFWPRPAAQAQGAPLLAGLNAADVVKLTISDGDGNQITLAKNGADWVLPEADDFPVQGDKITPFLDKLGTVKSNRLVTQTEGSHQRLQVAAGDFNRQVELTLADGTTHKLYLGSSAGPAATHVRADDRPEVFLTGDVNSWEANPEASAWIDTLYFTLPQTATVALTLENQHGKFEFEKNGDAWTMKGLAEGETLKDSEVTTLVNLASSVRLAQPIGRTEQADFGLAEPQAVVTLTTADDTYTLQVGAKNAETNNYVLKASNSPYYVWVSEPTASGFVNKTRADFLEAPPTPTTDQTSPSQ